MDERADEIRRADQLGDIGSESEVVDATGDEVQTVEIRADIEQTRIEMSETIDAIQDRLAPANIAGQAKEAVREATIGRAEDMVRSAGDTVSEARYGVVETIKQNPVPAALTGIGLTWLFMNRRSGTSRRAGGYQGGYDRGYSYEARGGTYGDWEYAGEQTGDQGRSRVGETVGRVQDTAGQTVSRVQDTAGQTVSRVQDTAGQTVSRAQETAGQVASQAQERAGQFASQAQQTASQLAEQAQYRAQRLEDRFWQTMHQNPLAVGAAAVAVGAAAGLAVPSTRKEQQLMGETRDNLMQKAQTTAQETAQKVQQVAQEVGSAAQQTAQEEAQNQGLTSG